VPVELFAQPFERLDPAVDVRYSLTLSLKLRNPASLLNGP